MIPADGLHTNADYPPEVPVLSTPRKVIDYGVADFDRADWVLRIRPALIASGNLIETEEHRKEFKKLSKAETHPKVSQSVAPVPAPISAAIRTPAGDWVPPDRKSAAAGEKDDEPDTPF